MTRQLTTILTVTAALLIAACSDDGATIADSRSAPATDEASAGTGESGENGGEDSDDGSGTPTEDCEDGPDRTVNPIDGVSIPETHYPEVVVEDEVVAGVEIPGFTVPELSIPSQTIDAGCIIEYDAAGGCLGKVVVTGVEEIPDRVMPGYEIPEVVGPDGEVLYEGVEVDEVVLDGLTIDGFSIDEVCQVDPEDEDDDIVWGVTRWGDTQWGETQWGETRQVCLDSECSESVTTPARTTPAVTVPAVTVPAETLPMRVLDGTDTQVLEDDEQTAYLAPADVLFEFDESDLTDEAIPTLETIADAIGEDFDDGAAVTVEGHTDSEGAEDYNQTLSEDRAAAVAAWLVDQGDIASDQITTAGYGETLPVASNDDDEGRAQNRRVVITVTGE